MPAIVINNWMKEKAGTAIGLALAFSGILGAVISPALSQFILRFGWKPACVAIGALALVLIIPSVLFLIQIAPNTQQEANDTQADQEKRAAHLTRSELILSLLCIGATASGTYYMRMANYFPQIATLMGYAITVRAMISSCCMLGNVGFKSIFGPLCDRLGVYRTLIASNCIILLSTILLYAGKNEIFFCVGAFLFGVSYSVNMVGVPQLLLREFGINRYKHFLSRITSINTFLSALIGFGMGGLVAAKAVQTIWMIWMSVAVVSLAVIAARYAWQRSHADKAA